MWKRKFLFADIEEPNPLQNPRVNNYSYAGAKYCSVRGIMNNIEDIYIACLASVNFIFFANFPNKKTVLYICLNFMSWIENRPVMPLHDSRYVSKS